MQKSGRPARQQSTTLVALAGVGRTPQIKGVIVNTRYRIAGSLFAGVLCLSACGSDSNRAATIATTAKPGTATTTTSKPATGATTTTVKAAGSATTTTPKAGATPTTSGTSKIADVVVEVATTSLGKVLTNGAGLTLYTSKNDVKGVSSACEEACANTWIPDTADTKPVAGTGVESALLSTIDRSDGTKQITYDGWPLYHYKDDTKRGDTKGEKVSNTWFAVDVEGKTV
jgi:predicted lipoprotein with Yx(FWY)xxD motif